LIQNANLRKTQMMACRHGNGKDWWLLKQEGDSANVHVFLFRSSERPSLRMYILLLSAN